MRGSYARTVSGSSIIPYALSSAAVAGWATACTIPTTFISPDGVRTTTTPPDMPGKTASSSPSTSFASLADRSRPEIIAILPSAPRCPAGRSTSTCGAAIGCPHSTGALAGKPTAKNGWPACVAAAISSSVASWSDELPGSSSCGLNAATSGMPELHWPSGGASPL